MKILLLDDHSLFSKGLGKILENYFANTAIDYFKSIKELDKINLDFKEYDLLITDIELPGEDIFGLFTFVKLQSPKIPVLVVTMHNKLSVVKKCKELGIEGYILKDDNDLVIDSVNNVLKGREYYSERVLKTLEILKLGGKFLTPKEEEIVKIVAKGTSNKEIAEMLFISLSTVKTHRKNINKKLGISSTAELVVYSYKNYIQ